MKTKHSHFFYVSISLLFLFLCLGLCSCDVETETCPPINISCNNNYHFSVSHVSISVCNSGKITEYSPPTCDIDTFNTGTIADLNAITTIGDGVIGIIVGDSGKILKITTSSSSGANWVFKKSNTTQNLNDVCFCGSGTGYAVGNSGTVIKTTDYGNTWQVLNTNITKNLNDINCSYGCANLMVFGDDLSGYKTTNGGSTWTQMPISGGDFQGRMPDLEASFFLDTIYSNALTGYVVGENFVVKTTNGGANWSMRSLFPPAYFAHVVYFSSPDSGIIMGDQGSVFYTIDGGSNWTLDDSASSITSKNIRGYTIIDTNLAVIVGDNGLFGYVSNDSIIMRNGKNRLDIASSYLLSQNYPNPFNPVTNIRYEIPVKSNVKLSVYDINGRLIRIPVNEIKIRGEYLVAFNSGDLPSGVYFYKIEIREVYSSERYTETKKMLLIK